MFLLIKEFFTYLRYPGVMKITSSERNPVPLLARLLAMSIVITLTAAAFSHALISFQLIPSPGADLIDHDSLPYWAFTLGAVFLAPLAEETLFRAPLRRFSGMLFLVSFVAGLLLSVITGTYWSFAISPFIFAVLFISYRFTLAGSLSRKFHFWQMAFPWQFYLTAIMFALVHLSNYQQGFSLLPYGILYTLPQLGIGLVLGFTRMRYGLKYAMLLHSLYNMAFTALLFSQY